MLAAAAGQPPLSTDTLADARKRMAAMNLTCADAIGDRDITWEDRLVPGPPGQPDITVTVLRPGWTRPDAPGFYNIHGGGMVMDNRFSDLPRMVNLIGEFGCVAVTVEYRLAPEHPHPAPVEDCYAGLTWMAGHAGELGFDPRRLVIGGGSAGGGLAAGVALLARDRGGPAIAGQMLLCPMIDDRNDSPSTHQYGGTAVWSRSSNDVGWKALLGADHGTERVLPYAAPARATDLSGLPPAFVEVGEAEIFRDEDVQYCDRLWRAGVPAELHVWAGAYHGFDRIAPDSAATTAALQARSSWMRRTLGLHVNLSGAQGNVDRGPL
ncbi:alpha/beta hydrolase [Actinobacteria bacterium YIM 96077]|uniref:Alpha/beta hydrolase n=1 Tax=Phytoactinopolyspora halophila TaxID=1981511 RepID=A0A329QJP1_9ACTN|nr:alpha/beta hydrolase [Actinobacteria bacterium YIM 96077]RAW12595.1 alpha/beta hydrolase [Phytoactinopolyspora halophila]